MMKEEKTSVRFCSAGTYLSEHRPMIHQRRRIDTFVLLLGIRQTLYISDGGNDYALLPNRYLLLAADREHVGTQPSPPGLSYHWCHFRIEGGFRLFRDEDGREWLALGEAGVCFPMYGEVCRPSEMQLLFHQLIDTYRTGGRHAGLIADRFLEIILAVLSSAESDGRGVESRICENVAEWIKLNATQLRGVGEIAAHFGYNPAYLTTLIKRKTGKSLTEHVGDGRMERARLLLREEGTMTVREVALSCGFADEKYFSRVFKRACGMTPSAFRNSYARQRMNDR